MSIRKIFFISLFTLLSACSNDLFLVNNGNMPTSDKMEKIHNGLSKDEVMNILGTPSSITGLSDNHWIYMESSVKKVAFLNPEEVNRRILAITFDNNKITKIEKLTLADGNNIDIDQDITKPTDQEQGFFRKYFGGVGTYSPFANTHNK